MGQTEERVIRVLDVDRSLRVIKRGWHRTCILGQGLLRRMLRRMPKVEPNSKASNE